MKRRYKLNVQLKSLYKRVFLSLWRAKESLWVNLCHTGENCKARQSLTPWIFGLAPCWTFCSRSQHGCVFFGWMLESFFLPTWMCLVWQAVTYFPRITPSHLQIIFPPPKNVNVQSVNESVKVVKYFCQNCEIYLSRQAAPDFPGIAPSHSTKPPHTSISPPQPPTPPPSLSSFC